MAIGARIQAKLLADVTCLSDSRSTFGQPSWHSEMLDDVKYLLNRHRGRCFSNVHLRERVRTEERPASRQASGSPWRLRRMWHLQPLAVITLKQPAVEKVSSLSRRGSLAAQILWSRCSMSSSCQIELNGGGKMSLGRPRWTQCWILLQTLLLQKRNVKYKNN